MFEVNRLTAKIQRAAAADSTKITFLIIDSIGFQSKRNKKNSMPLHKIDKLLE